MESTGGLYKGLREDGRARLISVHKWALKTRFKNLGN